ncbi:MAG: NADH-quinone oxidoreductase subunit G [Gammaproteobacteria bacterium]|nr:NADH-quinone oxidoreductase subunit G [Gammaproteobacteria bacterium]
MSEGDFQIEIDGRSVPAKQGEMIIHVADREGLFIPRFCYHEKLSIAANCRMCLVEVERASKPLPACATPVMDGMKIATRSAYARQAQKSVMEFLLINHPLDCPICDQGGECELQDLALGYGDGISRFTERKRVVKDKNLGPLIATDMTRCIHCTRCVRFGEEIAGMPELGATGRGEHLEIGTYIEKAIESELSGNVIDVCPVGALTSKPFRFRARAWEMQARESVAPHDPVGSNLFVHIARRQVMRVVPRRNDDINESWISDRDRFSYEGLYSADRLHTPRIKTGGEGRDVQWRDIDWDDALNAVVEKLRSVLDTHGADEIGVLASPNATVEEHYLLQKIARALGINSLDHRLREGDVRDQDEAPPFWSLGRPLAEMEGVNAVLLVGCDVRKEVPLVNHRLRKAAAKGATIRQLNAVDYANNVEVFPGRVVSPAAWGRELAAIISALVDLTGACADGVNVVEADDWHRAVAKELHDADKAAVVLGAMGAAHPHSAELRTLAARIGQLAGASAGMLPLGANQAGAALAGMLPHRGPGGAKADRRGADVRTMLERSRKAYLLLGVEPELDCWDGGVALAALNRADCVINMCAYATQNAQAYSDVLLPMALFAETDGTMVNADGQWQYNSAALSPPGEARPAWKILRVLGNLLELDGFDYMRCDAIRDEVRRQCKNVVLTGLALTSVTPRLDNGEAPGPESPKSGLPKSGPPKSGQLRLWRCGDVPMYAVDPLVRRATALQNTPEGRRAASVRLHPVEAERLGLSAAGQNVVVRQNGVSISLPLEVDDGIALGCALVPSGLAASAMLHGAVAPISLEAAADVAPDVVSQGEGAYVVA